MEEPMVNSQSKNKKMLAICGDSWFSTDTAYPGQSFGEILADKHNLTLESLARCGCSNFGIALQINKAIELRPDFIIVGCTSWDRIEIPMIPQSNFLKDFLNWSGWPKKSQSCSAYIRDIGLLNVKYSHAIKELSSQYSQSDKETIICESINNLLWSSNQHLSTEVREALEKYILNIYDSGIKQQNDCWTMSDAARRLVGSKIPFLVYVEPLFNHDFIDDIAWLDLKYKIMYNDFSFNQYKIGPTNFHLDFADSLQFAQQWENRLFIEGFLD
jgi:hypothetical protein